MEFLDESRKKERVSRASCNSNSITVDGVHKSLVQTLEFIANMQEGEKVLIFTGRKIT